MTNNTSVVVGGYYETNENKIAYVYGVNEKNIISMFHN
jgi:hypothetical protein